MDQLFGPAIPPEDSEDIDDVLTGELEDDEEDEDEDDDLESDEIEEPEP